MQFGRASLARTMYVDGREAVGREVEQARIVSFLADAQDARALLLEGEPGIGKSVLLEATVDLAAARIDRQPLERDRHAARRLPAGHARFPCDVYDER